MSKPIVGKDGKMHLYSKGVHFADAERFTIQFLEKYADGVLTGMKLYMLVQDITVTDAISADKLIDELINGGSADIAFEGKYKTRSGFAERVVFRNCATSGSVDLAQLARGSLDAWALWVNATEEEIKQLDRA